MLLELNKELHNQKTELKSGFKAVGSYMAAWTNLIQYQVADPKQYK